MAIPDSKNAGTRVLLSEDGRGNSTIALRAFSKGELIFKEPPLALVYPSDDLPWMQAMRTELQALNEACAWQYCVAVHCLAESEMPKPLPEGLSPMSLDARKRMEELCGAEDYSDDLEPSDLADVAVRHVVAASAAQLSASHRVALKRCLDTLGARVSRNGFQIMDLSRRPPTSADGLFHRISFCNHCCASLNNASWTWDGAEGMLSLKASRDIAEGEELTISYIAKPWSDLAKPARQRYLQQNFNFLCLCKACTLPPEEEEALRKQLSSQRDANSKSKPTGKLAGMLQRWMQDGHEAPRSDIQADVSAESQSTSNATAAKPEKLARPLTDEDRIARVLDRCRKESIDVSEKQARAALLAEEGHVGKTFIRLKREFREGDGSVANGHSKSTAPGVAEGRSEPTGPAKEAIAGTGIPGGGTTFFFVAAAVVIAAITVSSMIARRGRRE